MLTTTNQGFSVKHTFTLLLLHKQDCVNFLSEHKCLSTAGIGLQQPSKEAVTILSGVLEYRQQRDPFYRTRPALEAAGPHTVLGALCKLLSGLHNFRSKKVYCVDLCYNAFFGEL